jgi:hypothetical protein
MIYKANTCLNLMRNCVYSLEFVVFNFKGINML